jgi:GT2 family glycosyltransferase
MTTSAIVVTYNSADCVEACIRSLQGQVEQIIIVDNASQDTTASVARSLGITPIELLENKGFAYAANYGAAHANGQWLFFINPDTAVSPGAVAKAYKYAEAHSRVGIIGLGLYSPSGTLEPYCAGQEPTIFRILTRKLRPAIEREKPQTVDWVSGGACLISREAFRAARGFDDNFFLYWEDVDICHRLRQIGYKVVHMPQARVIHQRGGSLADMKRKTMLYDRSADRYYLKHYPTLICSLQRLLRRFYRYFQPTVW